MHWWRSIIPLWCGVLGSIAHRTGEHDKTTIITSDVFDGVDITYNEVSAGICGNAISYSGYVNFPPNSMRGVEHDYPIHTFFWYFKSQTDTQNAPLIIWMNGGPGASSMFGLFTENGPCSINSKLEPEPRLSSWNQFYNVLYVDQPVQTGFSYDIPTPGFLDLETSNIIPEDPNQDLHANTTFIPGTFSSQNINWTANTTENAARHFWNFLQVWSQDFNEYSSSDDSISIWTESYGGRYGPGFAAFIEEQNLQIRRGSLTGAKHLNIKTLGIVNGCVDLLTQETSAPDFAYDKNTYGIPGITREEYEAALMAYDKQPGGCLDKINDCLSLGKSDDPAMYGNVTNVNKACEDASDFCQNEVEGPYIFRKQWAFYDIAHCYLDAFPGNEYLYYLSRKEILQAIGVPVNYTDISNTVGKAFNLTGDYARRDPRGYLEDIASLLDSGIQVAMVYGDRDFACNWIGGERVSRGVEYSQSDKFGSAGYSNITIDGSDPVGQVRQHGMFSFSRIYQSGHMVPSYQPDVTLSILRRVMGQRDVATGNTPLSDEYSTDGTSESTTTLTAPEPPSITCYLRGMASTCAQNQIDAIKDGSATIENGVIRDPPPQAACPTLPTSSDFMGELRRH
ncbi:carboxypeptidase S1 [Xylaria scruposa]|nr:carboxypeptidase S1 [Xylaria scruposa]